MIDSLLSRLDKVREVGSDSWVACCPAHDDKSPSLKVTNFESSKRICIHCFAGCSAEEILSAVGLSWSDLFTDQWDAARNSSTAQKKPLGKVDQLKVEENVLLILKWKMEKGAELTTEEEARGQIAYERVREAYSA